MKIKIGPRLAVRPATDPLIKEFNLLACTEAELEASLNKLLEHDFGEKVHCCFLLLRSFITISYKQ
jgi:hypothetical protein